MTHNSKSALALSALALGALGLTAARPAAATVTLTNGNFNAGQNGSSGTNDQVSGFTGTQVYTNPNTYKYAFGEHYADPNNDPTNGTPSAYINGGSIYQNLGTAGAAGQIITITGSYGQATGTTNPPSTFVEFTSAAPTLSDQFAVNSVLASQTLNPAGTNTFSFSPIINLSYTVSAAEAGQAIYLVLGGPTNQTTEPDNVNFPDGGYTYQSNYAGLTLTTQAPSPAPEPSQVGMLALMGLGLGGLMLRARKAKAVAA